MTTALPPADHWPELFRIGTRPLDLDHWIVVNERLPDYLDQKSRLFTARPAEVFGAEPDTETAQRELLALLVDHLVTRFPETYVRIGETVGIVPANRKVNLKNDTPPLIAAASLVQEDLVLMRRGESGWRLAAGAVCFPSSWLLGDKLGHPIHEVHGDVPGFGPATRNNDLINRMFDAMRPDTPMLRWNWSLYGDAALFHPFVLRPGRFGAGETADPVFLRIERQTLRRLPATQDIAFTIRIQVEPLDAVEHHPAASQIVAALLAQIESLDAAQLEYKGLTHNRDRLIARLSAARS